MLWWLNNDRRLGPKTRALIASPSTEVCVSVASLWEVAVKVNTGKLVIDVEALWLNIERNRFTLLAISVQHLTMLVAQPRHHGDPFDRLLIAQALSEKISIVSDDRCIPLYGVTIVSCTG